MTIRTVPEYAALRHAMEQLGYSGELTLEMVDFSLVNFLIYHCFAVESNNRVTGVNSSAIMLTGTIPGGILDLR